MGRRRRARVRGRRARLAGRGLPASGLAWKLLLQHCGAGGEDCHTHTVQTWSGVDSGTFVAPDHEYPSYLELELTATDGSGLTSTVRRRLDPKTVSAHVRDRPAGLQLSVGSFSGPAPFTRTVIQGSTQSLSAPAPQTLGGTTYGFTGWSDGGAQNHSIVAPSAPATYRATFAPQAGPGRAGRRVGLRRGERRAGERTPRAAATTARSAARPAPRQVASAAP